MNTTRIAELFAALAAEFGASPAAAAPTAPTPAGTVTMPRTGSVLPVPTEAHQTYWAYAMDAALSLGRSAVNPMAATSAIGAYADVTGVDPSQRPDLWPEVWDRAERPEAYMSEEERKVHQQRAAAAQQQWEDHWAAKRKPPTGYDEVEVR